MAWPKNGQQPRDVRFVRRGRLPGKASLPQEDREHVVISLAVGSSAKSPGR